MPATSTLLAHVFVDRIRWVLFSGERAIGTGIVADFSGLRTQPLVSGAITVEIGGENTDIIKAAARQYAEWSYSRTAAAAIQSALAAPLGRDSSASISG